MIQVLKLTTAVIYIIVGIISMIMAYKSLFSDKFLPFHEKASDRIWEEIESPLQIVILTLMRTTGLGFLIVSILLLVFPIINIYCPNRIYEYFIPGLALIFCTGLFFINYTLERKTKATTPWRGSLYAAFVLIIAIIISILTNIVN